MEPPTNSSLNPSPRDDTSTQLDLLFAAADPAPQPTSAHPQAQIQGPPASVFIHRAGTMVSHSNGSSSIRSHRTVDVDDTSRPVPVRHINMSPHQASHRPPLSAILSPNLQDSNTRGSFHCAPVRASQMADYLTRAPTSLPVDLLDDQGPLPTASRGSPGTASAIDPSIRAMVYNIERLPPVGSVTSHFLPPGSRASGSAYGTPFGSTLGSAGASGRQSRDPDAPHASDTPAPRPTPAPAPPPAPLPAPAPRPSPSTSSSSSHSSGSSGMTMDGQ